MFGIDIATTRLVPTFGVAGYDTDMAITKASGLEFANSKLCGSVIAINARECLGHIAIPW